MKIPKLDKDVWIIIIILLLLSISTFVKSVNKERNADNREVIIDTVYVEQICIGGEEQECITLTEPKLMNIVKRKDEKGQGQPYIVSFEPKEKR